MQLILYKQYFVSSFFLLFINLLASQEYVLSGTIVDGESQPVSYANILLIKASDSTVYKGTSSNEQGKFFFKSIDSDRYILHISFVGFKDYQENLDINNNEELATIVLEETTEALNEVEIIAKKPTLKKENDRLVFNVENTTLTEGSIWDVLKGTPGILMINDEITVKNSGHIIYLINGKRVYLDDHELQQLLSGTNANAVKSVEVITNPPAKYDASGGAVINITMSKNLVAGYNGNIYGNYTQGIYPRYNLGTGHFFKGEKLNVYLGYSYDYKKVNRYNKEDILFTENATTTGMWHSDIDRNTKSKTHNVNANVDYDIDTSNTLSFSANTTITPYWKRKIASVTDAVDSTFQTVNYTGDDTKNLAVNLGYQHVNKKGNTFSTNFNYTGRRPGAAARTDCRRHPGLHARRLHRLQSVSARPDHTDERAAARAHSDQPVPAAALARGATARQGQDHARSARWRQAPGRCRRRQRRSAIGGRSRC